jgi:hypothetical protein
MSIAGARKSAQTSIYENLAFAAATHPEAPSYRLADKASIVCLSFNTIEGKSSSCGS